MTRFEKIQEISSLCRGLQGNCDICPLAFFEHPCYSPHLLTDEELDEAIRKRDERITKWSGESAWSGEEEQTSNEEHRMTVADIDKVLNRGYWVCQPKKQLEQYIFRVLPDELKDMVVSKVDTRNRKMWIEVEDG